MTEDEKKARAEKARAARAEAARKRSDAVEKIQLAEIEEVWDRIDTNTRLALTYIADQIESGDRTPEDVTFLRETRAVHFNRYRKHL